MSITAEGLSGERPNPSIIRLSDFFSIFAPRRSQAWIAALVSSEKSGFKSSDLPCASEAMITALMVWDFEDGMVISPESLLGMLYFKFHLR